MPYAIRGESECCRAVLEGNGTRDLKREETIMYRLIALFAFGALLVSTGTEAQAQTFGLRLGGHHGYSSSGYSFGSNYLHNSYHNNLEHKDYHRALYHRDAHRYPMTYSGHNRLHDNLEHDSYHDRLQHRGLHRSGAFRPSWGFGLSGRGYSIRLGW